MAVVFVKERRRLAVFVITLPLWILLLYLIYLIKYSSHIALFKRVTYYDKTRSNADEYTGIWKFGNYLKLEIPDNIMLKASSIAVKESLINNNDGKTFYRETVLEGKAKPVSVLLLHGAAFTSKVWLDIGTQNLLGAMGYRTVSVDLPGFGNSSKSQTFNRQMYLKNLIDALGLHSLVIISPSMSGSYSIPYLLEHWKEMSGYVPVSPVSANLLEMGPCKNQTSRDPVQIEDSCPSLKYYFKPYAQGLGCIKVPVLVVFGEHDRHRNSGLLCQLPQSTGVEISNGKHSAYLTNPNLWHKLLFNFLLAVETLGTTSGR